MNLKPKFPIIKLLIAIVIYFFIASFIINANRYSPEGPLVVYALYLIVVMVLTYFFLKSDMVSLNEDANTFKRMLPFENYGATVHEFQYSFKASSNKTISEVCSTILSNLQEHSGFSDVKSQTITDIDKTLINKDSRDFVVSHSEETVRGGKVTYLLRTDSAGSMHSVKWWFLLSGPITRAAIVSLILFSPLTIPLWIIPRLRGDHNLASNLRSIYPAYYESHDLFTIVNCSNKLTMDTLIKELSDRGIDTSDLKAQLAQSMNINVSGGKASFGSVVQGAVNTMSNASGGAK